VHYTAGLRQPLLVGNASATGIVRIPAANSTGTSLRPGTRPAHVRIPSADSIRSPRGAYAPRSWLRLRTLLQMCDSGRRKRCFSTGGLRPPLLAARCRAGAPNAEAVTKNSGHAGPWNPSVADCRIDPPTASRVVRLLPRLWNRGLADWGMEPPTASRIVRLLPRLWNRSLVDWGMEPPTADRGVRLLPRLWNRSVTDRTMDRGAVQDLFTAHRCGLLSRAACTVNPGAVQKGQDASNCELPMAQRIEAAPVPFGKAIPHRTRNLEGVNQPCSDLA
jgi:hypothetical protein